MKSCSRWFVLIICIKIICSQDITLENNGYQGILIAISDSIPYNKDLVPRIQELFTEASKTLFAATKTRAYFQEITVLIPSNWNVSAGKATSETFERANIRIDLPSSRYGDNPRVSQSAGCGTPGDFMLLTPEFLLNKVQSQKRWGPLDKVIVHEWGHLRWGLFDEYPITDKIEDHFYYSPTTNSIQPSKCSLTVKGENLNQQTGEPCKIDPATSLYENGCRFYPDSNQRTTGSSLMYFHFLQEITDFCDDDDLSPMTIHNYEAPSLQNKLCSGKSSWSVMLDSVDFANGKNPGRDDTHVDTSPSYKIIKRREDNPVVIVMDVSGSMEKDDNSLKLANAVRNFIQFTIADGSHVGLVNYSTSATALTKNLVEIKGQADRDSLTKLVTVQHEGSTAIGKGLIRAMQILEANSKDLNGSRIILLTDGKENVKPNVAEVKPDIIRKGVIVDTILLTGSASNKLISLAAETGGLSFYSSGGKQSMGLLYDSYKTAETSRYSSPSQAPITILSKVYVLNKVTEMCENITIDKSLGRDTTFMFSWTLKATKIDIKIFNPLGEVVNASKQYGGRSAAYRCIGECPSGRWSVCLGRSSDDSLVIQVESSARAGLRGNNDTKMPITVRTRINNTEPDFEKDSKPVYLYATVTRGYSPVIGAKVVATIESPNGIDPLNLMLRDDGLLGDNVEDDGVYSTIIANTKEKGKHSISVKVLGTSNTSVQSTQRVSNAAKISKPGDTNFEDKIILTPIDEFQRFSLAGFVDVKSVVPADKDTIPPAKITDLKVVIESYDLGQVTLAWTAVGDDYDNGIVSFYEVWYASTYKGFYKGELQNATIVHDDDIVHGNLSSPALPGEQEYLTITVEDRENTTLYGVIAVDEAGNKSPLSNAALVHLAQIHSTADYATSSIISEVTTTHITGSSSEVDASSEPNGSSEPNASFELSVSSELSTTGAVSASTPSRTSTPSAQNQTLILAISIPGGVLLLLFVLILVIRYKNRAKQFNEQAYTKHTNRKNRGYLIMVRQVSTSDAKRKFLFSSKANARKEIESWGKDYGSLADPTMRSAGQLTENVTEARMLQSKIMDMSKERYKYMSQAEFGIKFFLSNQKRKTRIMPQLLNSVDIEYWISKKTSKHVPQYSQSHSSNARFAFLERMETSGEKCKDFEAENPFEMPQRPKIPEKKVPEFYRIRLKEMEEAEISKSTFPTQPILQQSAANKTVKFCQNDLKDDLKLPLVSPPVNNTAAVRQTASAGHSFNYSDRKEKIRRVQSGLSQQRSVSDPRYQGLESSLSSTYASRTADTFQVQSIINSQDALHVPSKHLQRNSKPRLQKTILEYLRQRGFDV